MIYPERYMVPGGHGIKQHDAGLLYRRVDVDPIIETLRQRAEKAEAERDRLRESAAALCVAVEKQKSYGLPAISPQVAIALHDIRAALRQDEGGE